MSNVCKCKEVKNPYDQFRGQGGGVGWVLGWFMLTFVIGLTLVVCAG